MDFDYGYSEYDHDAYEQGGIYLAEPPRAPEPRCAPPRAASTSSPAASCGPAPAAPIYIQMPAMQPQPAPAPLAPPRGWEPPRWDPQTVWLFVLLVVVALICAMQGVKSMVHDAVESAVRAVREGAPRIAAA